MRIVIILSLLITFLASSETIGNKKSSQSAARIRQDQKPQQSFSQSRKSLPKTPAQKPPQTKPATRRILYDYAFFFGTDTDFDGDPVTLG
jgi:hypothetical protein